MKRTSYLIIASSLLLLTCFSCNTNSGKATTKESKRIKAPEFDADSAYQYIQSQVDFGPRIPNSAEHRACGEYLANKLAEHGATVINQYADLTAHDGTILKARNIIGSYNPDNKKRIMLFAHWDSRPWADKDVNKANHRTPVLGANDGASGVGILLEIARLIEKEQPELGIDILFFDAEDYGAYEKEESWCLGSQYWSHYPHIQGYNARFGILFDMVGNKQATFYREAYSNKYAKSIVNKVWQKAGELGYGAYFLNEDIGRITDDHLFVNKIANIPSIDIISYNEGNESGFGSFWHTVTDTMDEIDRSTLKAVGQTVLEVIYNEK